MTLPLLEGLLIDGRHILRSLVRRPAYASAAIATLSVGIGVVAACFTVLAAGFLRPLPFRAADELVWIDTREPSGDGSYGPQALSALQFSRLRQERSAFVGIEAIAPTTIALSGEGEPEMLRGAMISAGLLELLGSAPLRGRSFTREEERRGNGVAIISYGLWQRRYGGREEALGASVLLDDQPCEIVGIMPAGFAPAMQRGDVWVPVALGPEDTDPRFARLRLLSAVGRLRHGLTSAQSTQALSAMIRAMASEFPEAYRHTRASVVPLREQLYGPQRASIFLVCSAVLLLLVLACANLTSVALSHVISRSRETLVRRAIGASTRRLIGMRLMESLAIASIGALGALVIAALLLRWFASSFPSVVESYGRLSVDGLIASGSIMLAVAAGVAIGVPGAWHDARITRVPLQLSTHRVEGGRSDHRVRSVLLALQVGLALVLLGGAGLLSQAFHRLVERGPGFSPEHVLTFQFHPSRQRYATVAARADYVSRVLDELSSLPGVVAVGSTQASFGAAENMQSSFEIEGRPADPGVRLAANIRHVTPGYFTALRVPIVAGRPFAESDRADAPMVAIVSQSFARRFWSGESALGKRMRRAGPVVQWLEVVGIAADVQDAGLTQEPAPTFYVPYLQQNTPTARVTVLVRTRDDPANTARAAQQAVWRMDRTQGLAYVSSLTALLGRSVAIQRLQSALFVLFAVSGLGVAIVGLYGTVAFNVAWRTREIAIRSALGARRHEVAQSVLLDVVRPVLVGVLLGVFSAVVLTAVARQRFPDTVSQNGWIFAGASLVLMLVATVAALPPIRRALRIDPASVLRNT